MKHGSACVTVRGVHNSGLRALASDIDIDIDSDDLPLAGARPGADTRVAQLVYSALV